MPFEYEALVGHLYVVSGRAIRSVPPGALVEVSPIKAARGRETETFFSLVTPTDEAIAPTAFYEELARMGANAYFAASGSVTSSLREVFNELNQELFQRNERGGGYFEANMICGVLHGDDFIVGRVGSNVMMLCHQGQTESFPENLNDDATVSMAPLGLHPIPNVKLSHYHVVNGTRLIFADLNLTGLDHQQVENTLQSQDVAHILVGLKEMALLQLTVMVVEFVPPEHETPPEVPEGASTTQIAQQTRRGAAAQNADANRRPRTADMGKHMQKRAQRNFGNVVLSLSRGLALLDKVIQHFFGTKEERKRGFLGTPVGLGAVVLLPVVIVSLVLMLWLSGQGTSEFELCVEEALNRASFARSVSTSDRATNANAWRLTLEQVDVCDRLRPGDAQMIQLRSEAQAVSDALSQITRREAVLINALPQARLTRIVAQGQDLYVFDEANQRVYQVTLTNDGLGSARVTPINEMRRDGIVDNLLLTDLIDITFDASANVVVAVDTNGVVVLCSPRFLECSAQRLDGAERWVEPVAITTWNNRLYVLDIGIEQGEIWRYTETGDIYSNPTPYFATAIRPVLDTATDLAIDGDGSVFVLLEEGVIRRYRSADPQVFQYTTFPEGLEITNASAMFLDDRATAQSIYVATKGPPTIFQTSFVGTYENAYRIYDESLFDLLEDVVLNDIGGREVLYAVSGNSIFAIDKGN